MLASAVMIRQGGLGIPANVKRGIHVRFRPLKNFADLFPIRHVFVFHLFHGGTCNDHPVKLGVANRINRLVKRRKMFLRRVL